MFGASSGAGAYGMGSQTLQQQQAAYYAAYAHFLGYDMVQQQQQVRDI